ncbi:hypothetical protein MNR02_14630 [Shinella sp. H4-D48]|uniref:hypothetical protein n=1 Tax=Shinella sp. H4-D48 TaxID=2925841 RepID=UPI001F539D6C|nr:hypothetical protein [Shinella sp. H4-D48]UNK37684.1 hypothetical protein MNR02_14630 [Shinella sp. H4-D48]
MVSSERTMLVSMARRLKMASKRDVRSIKHRQYAGSFCAEYLSGRQRAGKGRNIPAKTLIRFGITIQHSDGEIAAARLISDLEHTPGRTAIVGLCSGSHNISHDDFASLHRLDRYAIRPEKSFLRDFQPCIRDSISSYFQHEFGIGFPINPLKLDYLRNTRSRSIKDRKFKSYSALCVYYQNAHIDLWHFFFSDLFLYINKLLNIRSSWSLEDLEEACSICRYCGFDVFFAQTVLLRALSGDEIGREFCEGHLNEMVLTAGFRNLTIDVYWSALNGEVLNFESLDHSISDNPLEWILDILLYLYSAGDPADLLARLPVAYEHDTSVIYFVDWSRFRQWIEQSSRLLGPNLIFLSTVLTDELILQRFKFLFEDYWIGGATADLESYALYFRSQSYANTLRRAERSRFSDFLLSLVALPKQARRRTFTYLFRPTTIERLASILTPPITHRLTIEEEKKDEYIALSAQMAILNFAQARRIVSSDFIDQKREDIRTFMRNLRYADFKKRGMIRLNLYDIERDLERFFKAEGADYIGLLNHFGEVKPEMREAFADYVSEQVAYRICHKSKQAFDYILSNWLRHGWLYRPIENTVLEFTSKNPGFFKDNRIFLANLEQTVIAFNADALTIRRNTLFYRELKSNIREWLGELSSTRVVSNSLPLEDLARLAIDGLTRMLVDAQDAWKTHVRTEVLSEAARNVSRSVQQSQSIQYQQLLTGLARCVDETQKWIAVNARTGEGGKDFLFRALTKFEVENIAVGDVGRLDINFEVYSENKSTRMPKYDVKIPGQYLDVIVRLVDNTVQNAFRRSGMGQRTSFNFVLVVGREQLRLEIKNRFKTGVSTMRAGLEKLQASISRAASLSEEDLSRASRGEGGSGAAKIIYEFRQAFESGWTIAVDEKSLDSKWFSVIATLPISQASLIAPRS